MDDIFVFNFDAEYLEWRRVSVKLFLSGRWGYTFLCFNGLWFVVFGGCGR